MTDRQTDRQTDSNDDITPPCTLKPNAQQTTQLRLTVALMSAVPWALL